MSRLATQWRMGGSHYIGDMFLTVGGAKARSNPRFVIT
jgi:hypothetical protein